ncbi:hypothetical protein ACIBAG_25630 [Streptomyces sp. NPDC051243]|uniref:hypothetical protein n=1 Tax=Streptomyces sp. NPDC051243 TaxID=3365646 RepID=UPI00378CD4E2
MWRCGTLRLDPDLLDEVTLQSHTQDQPRRPVGEGRPERHMEPVEPQPVTVVGTIGHGQAAHDAHVVSGVSGMAAVHVVTVVSLTVFRVAAALFVMVPVHVVAALGRSVRFMSVVRRVLGLVLPAMTGALSASTVLVVSLLLPARVVGLVSTVIFMRGRVVAAPVLAMVEVRVNLVVMVPRRFPTPKLSESAIEDFGDLPGVCECHPGLGRRDGTPQIRRPVALFVALLGVVTAQNNQQVRLRRRTHGPPPSTYELGLDGEPLPGSAGSHRQQNSGPGQRRSHEPAPQLHRKAPSRQA